MRYYEGIMALGGISGIIEVITGHQEVDNGSHQT
jgi:hypothetical protein